MVIKKISKGKVQAALADTSMPFFIISLFIYFPADIPDWIKNYFSQYVTQYVCAQTHVMLRYSLCYSRSGSFVAPRGVLSAVKTHLHAAFNNFFPVRHKYKDLSTLD